MTNLFDTLQKETEQDVSELKIPPKFVPTTYHDVEFERQLNVNMRKTYNRGLAALRQRGYDRYPRPSEFFTLLVDSLEGKLSPDLEAVAKDTISWWWAWLSLAWERKGNLLISYLDPEGLVFDHNKYNYTKQNFYCASEHHFDIADKISEIWIRLSEFSDDFIEFHYGRKFGDLPQLIQQKGQIYLPPAGVLWPAGRNNYDDRYAIDYCYVRTSRGVKVKPAQKISSEKEGGQ